MTPTQKDSTALQTLIARLEEQNKKHYDDYKKAKGKDKDHLDALMTTKTIFIMQAKSLLPKERKGYEDAVTYGNRQESYDGTETLGQKYFEQTFKQ